jgi:hypothetical protein
MHPNPRIIPIQGDNRHPRFSCVSDNGQPNAAGTPGYYGNLSFTPHPVISGGSYLCKPFYTLISNWYRRRTRNIEGKPSILGIARSASNLDTLERAY